jgi:hypothetical protein
MKGLDAYHDAMLDRHLDQLDRQDAQSALADAERKRLLDMVIEVQGALTMGDKDMAMCILNELEKELT